MSKDGHLEEAKGDKAIKLSPFRWKKDYAKAATHFEESLKLFYGAADQESIIRVAPKYAKASEKNGMTYNVAKANEYLLFATFEKDRESFNPQEQSDLVEKIAEMYAMKTLISKFLLSLVKIPKSS